MDLSTLIVCRKTTRKFQGNFNHLYTDPSNLKINQARPLINIMRPSAS